MNVNIRPEALTDRQAIRDVNRAAFETEAEANLVEELQAGGYDAVSLVAIVDHAVVGHILFSPIRIVTGLGIVNALSLAPMAVVPGFQRQHIGSRLVVEGLARCRQQGHQIVTVLGHPAFYTRFGFSAESARPLASPFGDGAAWMAIELVPNALTGVTGRVEYSPPFQHFL